MAARVASSRFLQLNCGGILRESCGRLLYIEAKSRNAVSLFCQPSFTRAVSHFQRSAPGAYPKRRFQQDDEEELDYEVEDDNLEQLRMSHRSAATNAHSSQEGKQFVDFPLHERLCSRLVELGYSAPFEIQVTTLEHTLAGRDVVAKALTGSGKTLAFSVPIVHKLLERGRQRSNLSPKAIVISPTRELCMQIYRSIQELDSRIKCVAVYGGDSMSRQERELRRGVDVICATPGRLNDHLERGIINLEELEFLCLDEADELLKPGFKEQIESVLDDSPADKQVMLFSATMPHHIRVIANRYLNDPVQVDITANQRYKAPESVRHQWMRAPSSQHIFVVKSLVQEHKPERCIVFMETKHKVREAANILRNRFGLKADGITSDLSQSKRENIMAAFRTGIINILVATDVAARGLDIPEVDLVVQVSPPRNGTEYYLHRSGRTGRAGREGLAVLIHEGTPQDRQVLKEIEKLAKVEHVSPPDPTVILVDTAKETLEKLQRSSKWRLTESLLPMVEQLQLSAGDSNRLLASALATMVAGPTGGRPRDSSSNFDSRGQRSTRQQNHGISRPRGQRYSRGLSDMEDDDDYHGNSRGGRSARNPRPRQYERYYD